MMDGRMDVWSVRFKRTVTNDIFKNPVRMLALINNTVQMKNGLWDCNSFLHQNFVNLLARNRMLVAYTIIVFLQTWITAIGHVHSDPVLIKKKLSKKNLGKVTCMTVLFNVNTGSYVNSWLCWKIECIHARMHPDDSHCPCSWVR